MGTSIVRNKPLMYNIIIITFYLYTVKYPNFILVTSIQIIFVIRCQSDIILRSYNDNNDSEHLETESFLIFILRTSS